jgi:hypothetical protein
MTSSETSRPGSGPGLHRGDFTPPAREKQHLPDVARGGLRVDRNVVASGAASGTFLNAESSWLYQLNAEEFD